MWGGQAGEGWKIHPIYSVFLGYSPCRAYFPGWTSKSEDCPNLLAHCTWPSLKKAARCTCIPLWEPFHLLLSLFCTYKLNLLLSRGAETLERSP